ncbi:hypothetical protein CEXT_71731 [Caerostris extrusa]|uniref:Uncharacterized protein n=1 Tax=Caerostris extrusa TaxID=172846 RepID=A0AAV4T3Y2_CAEEX|nr:hypothetical protein CEXT_71731 [Caerostris extrusa]
MDIMICAFCKSYVTNFEVHNCFNLANQHHRSYATLPQNSSANLTQNNDLITTQPIDYEARWSSMGHINSSMQQNNLPGIHQRTGYEENAADEMFSWYGVTKQNPYNPETSHFFLFLACTLFKKMNPIQCILQLPYETFGQRNTPMHQMSQNSNAFSQLECSGMCSTNELPPHFTSAYHNFGERDHILPNVTSQYSGKTFEIPPFNIQKAQYSTWNLIQPTDLIEQTKIFPFTICEDPSANLSCFLNSVSDNREENSLNISETQYPNITDPISLARASDISSDNEESRVMDFDTLKFKEDENSPKHKQLADFIYGIAENVTNPSNASQIHQFNLELD